jgi:triacylglycerol lipase
MVGSLAGCGDATEQEHKPSEPAESTVPQTKRGAADATNQGKADWGIDICERNSWYGDRACDWFCPKRDSDCELEPLGRDPSGDPTRYPIVLAHGFMGSETNFWSFYRLAPVLRDDGHTVFETSVPPFHSVKVRAEKLAEQVDSVLADTGADKVNLVAHSMGGLDCRYMVSSLGYDDRVASVTTIATPHDGSRIADVYLNLVPGGADRAVDALARLAGGSFSDVADEADVRAAMHDIAEQNADDFNAQNPDADGVYYQSWAGVSSVLGIRVDGISTACEDKMLMHDGTMDHMAALLWPSAALVAGRSLTLNDGMVTVDNAKWGEFRGCIPADHLDQVGQINHDEADDSTAFDHLRFHRNLAFELSILGF